MRGYKATRVAAGHAPGSPEWLRLMTASKVSAVLGVSPWESPFGLWHRMNGTLEAEPGNDDTARGHYHEAGVLAWFKDQHPELRVRANSVLWQSKRNPRYAATPDGIALEGKQRAGVEIKTSAYESWDEGIPVHYRVQCVWQAHVIGLDRIYVAALTKNLRHVEHVLEYDAEEGDWIEAQVRGFLDSLDAGQAPPIDGHAATTKAIKKLHPQIDPTEVEISPSDFFDIAAAKEEADLAEERLAAVKNELAAFMGNAERAVCDGQRVAARRSRNGGTPYLQLASGLPEATQIATQIANNPEVKTA